MRGRLKFFQSMANFTLKDIKRLEVQFDPFHKNAVNIREFFQGVTSKKSVKTNEDCLFKYKILPHNSNPSVLVKFQDDHNLVIDCEHLESGHIAKLISEVGQKHAKIEEVY